MTVKLYRIYVVRIQASNAAKVASEVLRYAIRERVCWLIVCFVSWLELPFQFGKAIFGHRLKHRESSGKDLAGTHT